MLLLKISLFYRDLMPLGKKCEAQKLGTAKVWHLKMVF